MGGPMQKRPYVSLKKEGHHGRSLHSTVALVFCLVLFFVFSFFMRNAFNAEREELIESLKKEREMTLQNEKLKVELSGITRGRYIELKAKERLGLKKPKEEEVLVLRHE